MKNSNYILIGLFLVFVILVSGCVPEEKGTKQIEMGEGVLWAKSYDGGYSDGASSVAIDSNDNIIVTGYTQNGTVIDGVGVTDYLTIKYNPRGKILWIKKYDDGGFDWARDVAIDSNNNIIVTGRSVMAKRNWRYEGNEYYNTIKYDSKGNVLWIKKYDSRNSDEASSVAIDSNNNIIVTGTSGIKPSKRYYNIYSLENTDYVTIKYDSKGNVLWIKKYDGGDRDVAHGVIIDSNDNAIITGSSKIGDHFLINTVKYDPSGKILWSKSYSNRSSASSVAIDSNDNIIVTGYTDDVDAYDVYLTIKYDPNGNQIWARSYRGSLISKAKGIAVDSADNIVVTGGSGAGSFSLGYLTIKYNPEGNILWNAYHSSGVGDNEAYGVAVDSDDNIIVTGVSVPEGNKEIDSQYNYFTIKYRS